MGLTTLPSKSLESIVTITLLSLVVVAIMFPLGMAVWALNSYSNYMEHNDKCQLLAEHLPTGEKAGVNFSKSQDNPIVQKWQKECT